MLDFVWIAPLLGGVLIGLAASIVLLTHGRVAGISGIYAGLLRPQRGDVAWRVWFVAGLLAAGCLAHLVASGQLGASPRSLGTLIIAGLCVGFGTRMADGCTSGHGVCGVSRLSPRSIVATITFMASSIMTLALFDHFGGSP